MVPGEGNDEGKYAVGPGEGLAVPALSVCVGITKEVDGADELGKTKSLSEGEDRGD